MHSQVFLPSNRLALKPGDHILLACGSVFEKQFLQIRDSGTKQMPIVIGSYGCGEDPLIKTDGQGIWYQDYGKELDSPTHVYHGYVSSAVLLFDAEYIIIQDIEIIKQCGKVTAKIIHRQIKWSVQVLQSLQKRKV